ncbi:MAG: carbon monoxide dehydrogenase [Azospirillum sp.]|nr:carbon monoxide dehydrogenase [Azospirillum sp.]
MYDFDYHRPTTIADAVALLAQAEDGRPLAGGQSLIPTLKQRLAKRSDLVDLSAITELRGIRDDGGTLVIGAMTRHAEVAASDLVRSAIPALAATAESVGDAQVRNLGTLGGSIANNDPSADYPAALVGLGATIVTDRRSIAAEDFFTGLFETALAADELVVSVRFPRPDRAAYQKFPNPASRYAVVGVFVAKTGNAVRVAVTGAGAVVFRHSAMEAALTNSFTPAALEPIETPADDFNGDIHASQDYRAHLVKVMAKRAVAALQ